MRDWLTDDEADTVMANIHPRCRRWCSASCGPAPGDDLDKLNGFGCACTGCIYGSLSWAEFSAWQKRESERDPTPWAQHPSAPLSRPRTLAERLKDFKAQKRL